MAVERDDDDLDSHGVQVDGTIDLPTDYPYDPAVPATGITLYSKKRGFRRPAWVGPDGYDVTVQSFMGRQSCRWLKANAGTASISADGLVANVTGTNTLRAVAFTSYFAAATRVGLVTAATAGATAGLRHGSPIVALGAGSGQTAYGGFEFICRFGINTYSPNMRLACGLFANTASLTNQEASANTNFIGIGKDGADTTLSIMSNGASGTATKIALGANFPATTAGVDFYELTLYTPPGGTTVAYAVARLNTGDYAEGVITSPLPGATVALGPQLWCSNNATAAAVALDMSVMYLETDT